ncbi:hypothetical protein, partial [Flagellimonas lutimaris]|uniref:hypothetical protein n=1 Tax=Flagellimonas lutimaris TaxID=475082 RepID=UPI001C7209EC
MARNFLAFFVILEAPKSPTLALRLTQLKLFILVMSTLFKNPSNRTQTTSGRGNIFFVLFFLFGIGLGFGQAPSGYSVTIDQDPIGTGNETS